MSSRLRSVWITLIICFITVTFRLFYWQIIKNPQLSSQIANQDYKPATLQPKRGVIYDSSGYPLALNQTFFQASLYKPDLKIPLNDLSQKIIAENNQLLSDDINTINKFVNSSSIKWITLKTKFSSDQKIALSIPGFSFTPQNIRFYPEVKLASIVLNGLENFYNKQLQGKMGFVWETKDATGQTLLSKSGWRIDPVSGRDITTSLDRRIQYLTENILIDGVNQYSADSGSVIIIKPETGAIIAMASFSASSSATPSASRNPIITNLFEPGSIFKPLVMSMALDKKVIDDNYICTKCGQPHQIGEYAISNWDSSFHANTDLKDIIKNSDNIGMSYIIQRLGLNNFLDYFHLLGLDHKTGIDLQGEEKPLSKEIWPEIDLATASFGQGFAITQIQMLQAFNSIANGGMLVKPHFVESFTANNSIIMPKFSPPQAIYQIDTITKMKTILQYAVDNGVVSKFKPKDMEVCAKSGTAQIAIKGGYSDSSTIASYVGFSPCYHPKFTMIVTINNPRTSPWGSSTAAPIWYDLASKIIPLL